MPTNMFQYTAEEIEALNRDMRRYLAEQEIANRLQEKEDRYRRELEGRAQESAANAALAQRFVEQSLSKGAPAATGMRRSWSGPMPNRPVVNGRALVSAEELADFRRQFGAQMTLRDLLNADRRGAPTQQASAQNMRARGLQGVNSLPLPPGMIPGGAAGPAAPAARPRASVFDIPGLLARGMAEGAERVPFGRGLGAAFTAAGAARGAGRAALAATAKPKPREDNYILQAMRRRNDDDIAAGREPSYPELLPENFLVLTP